MSEKPTASAPRPAASSEGSESEPRWSVAAGPTLSRRLANLFFLAAALPPLTVLAQAYCPPDRGEPGDEMIQAFLSRESARLHAAFLDGVTNVENWKTRRPRLQQEYFYMLGLWPLPEKTPLHATVTGRLDGDGYVVEMLHYQSRPRLYVTANLYRPPETKKDQRLPAVLYVCGHSPRGRNGNKTAYQSHGIWFARHGYVCLILDTLQLGEIAGIHHGTYREGRWWWHSRGYTPAGVECWNGVRGIDYLIGRPDVDADRIAVTGISGGGAATYWIAAADPRVRAAAAVSGMADLPSYVANRVINGHCDCMFLYNTFQWPWTRIAALIAPRPLLVVNSDQDRIFPMDANRRVIARLERLYGLYGAGDMVDAVVSVGGHAYRKDIRQAAFRFINMHLKNDPRVVEDSEVDLVEGAGAGRRHPIDPEKLRVFPEDSDIPADQLNTTIDEHFVPAARAAPPAPGEFDRWKAGLLAQLRRVVFRALPDPIPAARLIERRPDGSLWLETERGIQAVLRRLSGPPSTEPPRRALLVAADPAAGEEEKMEWLEEERGGGAAVYLCQPRGVGPTRWTRRNPPNYVERSHVLLGRTVDGGRVFDVAASARWLRNQLGSGAKIELAGRGAGAVLAAYAALWTPEVESVYLREPFMTHMDPNAPQLLNVLRVCDIPDVLGMLAPRRLTIAGGEEAAAKQVAAIYGAAAAEAQFVKR